jgi:hypothetical protein
MLDRDTLGGRVDVNEGRRLSLMKGASMTEMDRLKAYRLERAASASMQAAVAFTTGEPATRWQYQAIVRAITNDYRTSVRGN